MSSICMSMVTLTTINKKPFKISAPREGVVLPARWPNGNKLMIHPRRKSGALPRWDWTSI